MITATAVVERNKISDVAEMVTTARTALGRKAPVLVICAYFCVGVAVFWPDHQGIAHHRLGLDWDFEQSVWFLDWIPHAIAHGLNPFASNALLVPSGVNLAQNTASPLLGLLTAPLAPIVTPIVRANLLLALGMPVSATAAFVVLRKWRVWGPAAALGGLLYGFSPYMMGQSRDHIELVFVPLPPFIALTVVSILQRRGSPVRLGIQLGLLMTAQYFISPELTVIVAIFTVAAVAYAGLRARTKASERAHFVLRSTATAVAVAGVILAYPVWMVVGGPQHFTGSTWPTINPYHNDLLSFVVPGPLQSVSFGMRQTGSRLDLLNGLTEAGGYIGIPTLLMVGVLAWRSRRSVRMQVALLLLVAAVILSLGPYLTVDGRDTHFPLPFLLFDHIPWLSDILPSRICFAEAACLAAVISFGLDDTRRLLARPRRETSASRQRDLKRLSVVVFTCVVLLLVATFLPRQRSRVATLPDALPMNLRRTIPAGDPVAITYPYPTQFTMQPMLWQTESDFGFRLLGGYAYHPDVRGHPTLIPNLMHPARLQEFLVGQDRESGYFYSAVYGPRVRVSAELVASTRTTLSDYEVRVVIVDTSVSGARPVLNLFHDALGRPQFSAGQFYLWINHNDG